MRIGVTGAYGYVGSKISVYLENKGHEIVRMDIQEKDENHDFIHYSLEEGIETEKISDLDYIIHLAYDFRQHSWENIREVNIEGTKKLFETSKAAGVEVIQISSLSAYEGCRSKYGKAKLELEKEAFDRDFTVVRPGLVFGEDTGSVLGGLHELVKNSPAVPVPMGGPYIHYLCHYNDLAELLIKLLEEEKDFETPVIAASKKGVSFRNILKTLAEAESKKLVTLPVPASVSYYGLKTLETVGLDIGLRSDSVLGLVHPNEDPDFEPIKDLDVEFRDFSVENLAHD